MNKARDLAHQAARDPLRAVQLAKEIELELEEVSEVARLPPRSRAPANRVFRVKGTVAIPPGGTIGPLPLKWPYSGHVIDAYGAAVAESLTLGTGQTSLSTSVQWAGGDRNIFTNGDAADFGLFAALFGFAGEWFPLGIYVSGTDTTWQFTFKNEDTVASHTPSMFLGFVGDHEKTYALSGG